MDGLGIVPGTTGNVDPNSAFPVAGDTGHASGTGTGQYGITPILGKGGTVDTAVNSIWDWLNRPFNAPMSPMGIGLIVGTIIVAIVLWNMILYHIRIAAETL